jgi:uncharacterized protein
MSSPLVLFAPGAGAPSTSPWMQDWAKRLASLGTVVPFDYPYQLAGKRAPDPLPKLIAAHREALAAARHAAPARRVVLAGKSMGSRVGCHLSLEVPVSGLVCFGYPLRGQTGKLRDQILRDLRTPVLFIQGTRDALCPLEELAAVRAQMAVRSELWVVPGGDHSLKVSRRELARQGCSQEDADAGILGAVREFLETLA